MYIRDNTNESMASSEWIIKTALLGEIPRRVLTYDITKTHSRLQGIARVVMVSKISVSKYRSCVIAYLMSEKKF